MFQVTLTCKMVISLVLGSLLNLRWRRTLIHGVSRSIRVALIAKNNIGFVDGTILQPTDPSNLLYNSYTRCHTMELFILNVMNYVHVFANGNHH